MTRVAYETTALEQTGIDLLTGLAALGVVYEAPTLNGLELGMLQGVHFSISFPFAPSSQEQINVIDGLLSSLPITKSLSH